MADKTVVMKLLDKKGISYIPYIYDCPEAISAEDLAVKLGKRNCDVFKTLVTVGKTGKNYVFVLPAGKELDLKKAAKCVGEKSIDMLKAKDLLPLTGYIHGGCSPIGMKKRFPSYIHQSASGLDRIFVSAGRVGCQAELAPADLIRVAELVPADLV